MKPASSAVMPAATRRSKRVNADFEWERREPSKLGRAAARRHATARRRAPALHSIQPREIKQRTLHPNKRLGVKPLHLEPDASLRTFIASAIRQKTGLAYGHDRKA